MWASDRPQPATFPFLWVSFFLVVGVYLVRISRVLLTLCAPITAPFFDWFNSYILPMIWLQCQPRRSQWKRWSRPVPQWTWPVKLKAFTRSPFWSWFKRMDLTAGTQLSFSLFFPPFLLSTHTRFSLYVGATCGYMQHDNSKWESLALYIHIQRVCVLRDGWREKMVGETQRERERQTGRK